MSEPPAKRDAEDRFFSEPPKPEAPTWTRAELEALWQRRRARHLVLALLPLYALAALFLYFMRDAVAGASARVAFAQVVSFAALAPLHLLLWWWAGRALLPAVVGAAALFVLHELVLAVLDPLGVARGIFLKLAIVLVIVQALRAARAAERGRGGAGGSA